MMAVALVKDHLKNRKLQNVIELFEEKNIKDVNIEEDGWDHEKLLKMGINLEGDRGIVLNIIAYVKNIFGPKSKILQDSIHGAIELHPLVAKFIDTPQFQRLRDIKQLGGVYYVYPGASHNRFEHSIGVCYLAGVFIKQLRERQPELGITDREVLCIKIAGLCHDMGHGPFSHLFQDLFIGKTNPKWRHEEASIKLLDHLVQVNNLHNQLAKYGLVWERDFPFISDLINGKTKDFNEKSFLYEIVANSISGVDVDKMDYLLRDCHGLGMKSTFDWKRYMLCCRVIQAGEDKQYHICPREKEVVSLYELFHMRDHLFKAAYQHKTKRLVEFMLNKALVIAEEFLKIPKDNGKLVTMSKAIEHMDAFTLLTDGFFYRIKTIKFNDVDPELHKAGTEALSQAKELLEKVEKRDLYIFINRLLLKRSPLPTPAESVTSPELNSHSLLPSPVESVTPSDQHSDSSSSDQAMDDTLLVNDENEIKCRFTTDGIIAQIAELACNGDDQLQMTVDEMKKEIELDQVKFNFGKTKGNPIEKMYFYKKHSPNIAVHLPIGSTQMPAAFVLNPRKFEEFEYRLYCKSKDKKIIEAIRRGLVQLCSENKNDFEVPPGENLD